MAIEIVDFPINSMVIFYSYVTVYQRVPWFPHKFPTDHCPFSPPRCWRCCRVSPIVSMRSNRLFVPQEYGLWSQMFQDVQPFCQILWMMCEKLSNMFHWNGHGFNGYRPFSGPHLAQISTNHRWNMVFSPWKVRVWPVSAAWVVHPRKLGQWLVDEFVTTYVFFKHQNMGPGIVEIADY